MLGAVKVMGDLIDCYDLITFATHEIGHALGLDHSNDANSIMREDIGFIGSPLVYYMTTRPIPDVDAKLLADRYPANSLPSVVPSHEGYAIVGSTFAMTDLTSLKMLKDVPQACWGVREGTPLPPIFSAYGYNPFLQTKGYGYLSLHLTPAEGVLGRQYVIGGGILFPTKNIDHVGSLPTDPPVSTSSIVDFAPSVTWGAQNGQVQICGRARASTITRASMPIRTV